MGRVSVRPSDRRIVLLLAGALMLAGVLAVAAVIATGLSPFPFWVVLPSWLSENPELVVGTILTTLALAGLETTAFVLRSRRQTRLAEERSGELAALFSLSQEINRADSLDDLVRRVGGGIANLLGRQVTIEVQPPQTPPQPGTLVLSTESGAIGSLIVLPGKRPLDPAHAKILPAVANLVAAAIERVRLSSQMEETRILSTADRFRWALLSSVSHDFGTPIGSIMGAASTLLSVDAKLDDEARRSLHTTILQSAERLNRYVRNLLDVTYVEADTVLPDREWVDMGDIVGSALQAVEGPMADWAVTVDIPEGLPLLRLDFVLIERVFVNLFENAAKFAGPGNRLEIAARHRDDRVEVTIFNSGSDIPAADLEPMFERFRRGGSEVSGTGLGLAICRGFMAAHDATIVAERDSGRGGVLFRLNFRVEAGRPVLDEVEDE